METIKMKTEHPAASNTTVAQGFAAALRRHGVDVIFGQSIPAALFLAAPHFGIRQIGYRTENAGVIPPEIQGHQR